MKSIPECSRISEWEIFPATIQRLKDRGLENVVLVAGGIIPEEDVPVLEQMGIKAIFGPGSSSQEIVESLKKAVAEKAN